MSHVDNFLLGRPGRTISEFIPLRIAEATRHGDTTRETFCDICAGLAALARDLEEALARLP
ncbi:MAG: hypothetical protein ACHQ1G_07625, partial [Planctomycetota bacterium]